MLLESYESLSCCVKLASGVLTWGLTILKENGLGKSNRSPKREVDFAFGDSSAGGSTGTLGVDDESAGMVSSVSAG